MPIQQGRHGYITIGGADYPVISVGNSLPRNLVTGVPLGNTWATNFAEGLKTSRLVVEFLCREKATEILATAFWNRWLGRTFTAGFDQTPAFTVVSSSGRRTRTYTNVKAESFVLRVAKGAMLGLTGVFVCPSVPTLADVTPSTYAKTVDNSPPLMFDRVTFGGITGGCYGAEITYSNNHLPDGPLDGTKALSAYDAGGVSVGATFTFPEHVAANEPFADGATITMAVAGAVTRTFSLTSCIPNNPGDLDSPLGQQFQRYSALVLGNTTTQPLVIT